MTREQLSRTVQALNETYATIERLKNPKRTSRAEADVLIVEMEAHAARLEKMIAEG